MLNKPRFSYLKDRIIIIFIGILIHELRNLNYISQKWKNSIYCETNNVFVM